MDLSPFYTDTLTGLTGKIPGALEQMTQAQREGIDMQRRAYDDFRGALSQSDGVNLPLMQFSAALGAPTRGGLGGALAAGMGAYAGALQQQRADNLSKAEKLMKLQEGLARLRGEEGSLAWNGIDRTLGAATKVGQIDSLAQDARASAAYSRAFGGGDRSSIETSPLPPLPAPTVDQAAARAAATGQVVQAPAAAAPAAAAPAAAAPAAPDAGPRLSPEAMQRYAQNQRVVQQAMQFPNSAQWKAAADRAKAENERMVPAGVFIKPDGSFDTSALRMANEAKRNEDAQSPQMVKMISEMEDGVRSVQDVIETLGEAKRLAPGANSGYTAIARARAAEALPDLAVPDWMSSKQSAQDTLRLNQIMRAEAIKSMSETLKGASTDREMQQFIDIIADPAADPRRKEWAIGRMENIAKRKLAMEQARLDQVRGKTFTKPGGGALQPAPGGSSDPVEVEMRRRGLIP